VAYPANPSSHARGMSSSAPLPRARHQKHESELSVTYHAGQAYATADYPEYDYAQEG
jgi:hypothetical protein